MRCKVFPFILLLCLLLNPFPTPRYSFASAVSQSDARYFPQTNHAVKDRFLAYWNAHGGLAQQGYPISDEAEQVSNIDGKTYNMQYFERAVFELHPENQPPNDVLLTLLGIFGYQRKYPAGAPAQTPNTEPGSVLFVPTDHRVGGAFLQYWQRHGRLAQQGYPISDEFQERSPTDGRTYLVQYFQRARFEYHREQADPQNQVLLGLLGREELQFQQSKLAGVSNLDDDTEGWSVPYCEVDSRGIYPCAGPGIPHYDPPSAVADPSRGGQSLRLALQGLPKSSSSPGHYANVMFRHDLPASAVNANTFVLDLWFLYRPPTTFNDLNWNGQPARIQALEFAVTKRLGGQAWDGEIQWSNVRNSRDLPSVWSVAATDSAGNHSWVPTDIVARPDANRWHHLVLTVSVNGGLTHYDSFAFDETEIKLSQSYPPRAEGGNLMTSHVQLDGSPGIGSGYEVFIDQVDLSWATR